MKTDPLSSPLTASLSTSLNIEEFLRESKSGTPILDVRTPAEYTAGHIPGALNLPLFDNEERKTVGTTYKQKGRTEAIMQGLGLTGAKLEKLAAQALSHSRDNKLLIHCWRGGMRSSSVAWLMGLLGVQTATLKKGYKAFRHYVIESFDLPSRLVVLGGRTGSGKTLILDELKKQGEQVIDLETLASHKGSAFGGLGQDEKKRYTQEQFENELAVLIRHFNPDQKIWIEDESRTIGRIVIPQGLWKNMRNSRVVFLEIPQEKRVEYLIRQYARESAMPQLKEAFDSIQKRLGNERYEHCIEALEQKDYFTACKLALDYYDRAYEFGLSKRPAEKIIKKQFDDLNIKEITSVLTEEISEDQTNPV